MSEPSVATPEAGLFGIKVASLIAGFAGGVVSLSFIRELSVIQAVSAVFTGMATAAFATPVLMHYMALPNAAENGAAFVLGLTAMNIVPGVLSASRAFRNNPMRFFNRNGGGDNK